MLPCDKIYTGQLPHSFPLILWYYELNLAGVFDVADLRDMSAETSEKHMHFLVTTVVRHKEAI